MAKTMPYFSTVKLIYQYMYMFRVRLAEVKKYLLKNIFDYYIFLANLRCLNSLIFHY